MKKVYFSFCIMLLVACTNSIEFILVAKHTQGLNESSKITLNGLPIGKVKSIAINQTGDILIKCKINADQKLPHDSKFMIENADLLGAKSIAVVIGHSNHFLTIGDTLLLKGENDTFPLFDSINVGVESFIDDLLNTNKQDSILIELRRLNDNLEKLE